MAVLPIKSEQRCKLCASPHRSAIDALLEMRANRESDEQGVRVNIEYVQKALGEWGIENPTLDNVRNHFRKHCQVVSANAVEAAQSAALMKLEEIDRDGLSVDVNHDLDWLWAIGLTEIRERVARGEKSGISPDLLMKVAAEKTRRQHNESQDELLKALTGGLAQAFQVPLDRGTKIGLPSADEPDVVDAEFEEVET